MGYVKSYFKRNGIAVQEHFRRSTARQKNYPSDAVGPPKENFAMLNLPDPNEEKNYEKERIVESDFAKIYPDGEKVAKELFYHKRTCYRWTSVDENNIETMYLDYTSNEGGKQYAVPLTPGGTFFDNIIFLNSNFEGKNFSGSFICTKIDECNLSHAKLDNSVIGKEPFSDKKDKAIGFIRKTSFEKASLRNVLFDRVTFFDVSLKGADLTGAVFRDCSKALDTRLDVRDSNITTQQVKDLLKNSYSFHRINSTEFIYRQYSFNEVIEACGMTDKQFEFLVLSGAIEVREKGYGKIVEGGFDPGKHHVPQWAFQDLMNTQFGQGDSQNLD